MASFEDLASDTSRLKDCPHGGRGVGQTKDFIPQRGESDKRRGRSIEPSERIEVAVSVRICSNSGLLKSMYDSIQKAVL